MPRVNEIEGAAADVLWAELGILATNVYVIDDGDGGAIVVDPGDRVDDILAMVGDRPVTAIFITHGHYDHVAALEELRQATGAPVIAGAEDAYRITNPVSSYAGRVAPVSQVDREVVDGDTIETGKLTWRVMHTPGHTEGCVCYYLEPSLGVHPDGFPLLISGDTLFHGTVGRTDLMGGDSNAMRESMGKLAELDDIVVALPGHNALTTIGMERERTINAILGDSWTRPVR